MSTKQCWDIETWKRHANEEHRKRVLAQMENKELRARLSKFNSAVPTVYDEDVECGRCMTNMGPREYVEDYSYCPYCGAEVDWDSWRSREYAERKADLADWAYDRLRDEEVLGDA